MANDVKKFLDYLNFHDYSEDINDIEIEKVILNKKQNLIDVIIKRDNILPIKEAKSLKEALNKAHKEDYKLVIDFHYQNKSEKDILEYVKNWLNELILNKPSLSGLTDTKITINEDIITIEVSSKLEEKEINKNGISLKKMLLEYGLGEYEVTTYLNLEMMKEIKKDIEEAKNEVKKTVAPPVITSNIIIGKEITAPISAINNIAGDTKGVAFEAYIFGIDTLERETINIITLKISDKTNSMIAKIFKKEASEYKAVLSRLKENNWYRFYGNVEFDNFSKDLVLSIRSLEEIPSKDETMKDEAIVPRVELHVHTMMSAMDGVVAYEEKNPLNVVKYAAKMGHKAIAITDHNCVQAFPDIYHTVLAINKGKTEEERFKVLYGAEMNIVNDDVDIVFNNKTYNLLNDTFVVFDTETTGFYAGSDQLIEIGAVKICNGKIIDRFDELIDPRRPIPKKITELTFITDEMVKGKRSEEEVTKSFLEWCGNLPLVAHNAKFDISFMASSCSKYNLGEFKKTVVDTMSMARILHPEWPNHKLQTLTKKFDVPWDEEKHHRADYDAEGTALAFYKMSKILDDRNTETTDDLLELVDIDSMVRFSYPFHACLIAKNRDGLKNLFKIISLANTKYLFKNEQPKIPRQDIIKLRDNLLIGSGCINGEIFDKASTKEDEELVNMMNFYDYIEVEPPSVFSHLIGEGRKFPTLHSAQEHLKRIIKIAKEAGKPVVVTGDVHNLRPEDKIYREIIVNQKFNGKLHPLNRKEIEIPNMYLRTTEEMMKEFSFLEDEELIKEIVVTNPNKIKDMCEEIEVIIDTPKPFAPRIANSVETMTELVYNRAKELYGEVLPHNIEIRLAKELYGDALINACIKEAGDEEKSYSIIHDTILAGKEAVTKMVLKHLEEEDSDEEKEKIAKEKLGGIIGANYDVIYLIAQKLVKHSNDEGFLVGSRGSVGSSFVANMMGITEVNSLSAHYRCPKCKFSIFEDDEGKSLGATYSCGFDLPDKKCPKCGEVMAKDGHDIPFATFLGFNADKVPDIDLNFSDLNQASAHEYTKVLFGVDNVYRAGTIGTVAEKTAYGYVKGYCENKNIIMRNIEVERLAKGCTGIKRTTGQHPGGIVVIPDYMEVSDFTPYQYPAEDPTSAWRTTHFDYHAIDADVLKLDILGHTDPTQLRMIQDLTGDDVTKVPLDDKDTMSIFTSTKALKVTKEEIMCDTGTLGVPEFGTPFTIQLVKDAKPTTFAELVKIAGLAHGTDVWLGNAQELIQKNICPFKDVIGCRDDIMVELMNRGVPATLAFKIMEFVRKGKAGKEPDKWAEYAQTLRDYNIPDWYIKSCQKIKYMFPKAHAAAYVTSAFRIAWYKVHKPLVYYATYFSTRFQDFDIDSMTKGYEAIKAKMLEIQTKGHDATNKDSSLLETLKLALEATARGVKFKSIDIKKSDGYNFIMESDENALIMPFRSLDGLGDAVATKIMEEREIKAFYSIEDFQNRGKVNQTTIDKMRSMGIFEGMPETSQLSLF